VQGVGSADAVAACGPEELDRHPHIVSYTIGVGKAEAA
jgi:hypothetical protein